MKARRRKVVFHEKDLEKLLKEEAGELSVKPRKSRKVKGPATKAEYSPHRHE